MRVYLHVSTTDSGDGADTDTKGLSFYQVALNSHAKRELSKFQRQHSAKTLRESDGHAMIRSMLSDRADEEPDSRGELFGRLHIAKDSNGRVVAAMHYDERKSPYGVKVSVNSLGSIHPGAGRTLIKHVMEKSSKSRGRHRYLSVVPAGYGGKKLSDYYHGVAHEAGLRTRTSGAEILTSRLHKFKNITEHVSDLRKAAVRAYRTHT